MNGNTERWVGIDVAKAKLDVAWLDERGKITELGELGAGVRS
jgi:hypothetical protein